LYVKATQLADALAGRANDMASELAETNLMAAGSDAVLFFIHQKLQTK